MIQLVLVYSKRSNTLSPTLDLSFVTPNEVLIHAVTHHGGDDGSLECLRGYFG